MDPISTALSVAWLDALRRAQSDMTQRMERALPQTRPSPDERTLTDVIENGLKSGGAKPLTENAVTATSRTNARLDILA